MTITRLILYYMLFSFAVGAIFGVAEKLFKTPTIAFIAMTGITFLTGILIWAFYVLRDVLRTKDYNKGANK